MGRTRRDALFVAAACLVVAAAVAAGFWMLGSPARQRELSADRQRVDDLKAIARELHRRWELDSHGKDRRLPASLDELVAPGGQRLDWLSDPVTGAPYGYQARPDGTYELCAVFATDSAEMDPRPDARQGRSFWRHRRGRHCFVLDASRPSAEYY
ncbi:MAG: hypothetical protein FJW35_05280 [Acidobacteria bacterium]|nr:hypothetical protein [Acidobacteriota bacterium]